MDVKLMNEDDLSLEVSKEFGVYRSHMIAVPMPIPVLLSGIAYLLVATGPRPDYTVRHLTEFFEPILKSLQPTMPAIAENIRRRLDQVLAGSEKRNP